MMDTAGFGPEHGITYESPQEVAEALDGLGETSRIEQYGIS
jgi:hypothetical protein